MRPEVACAPTFEKIKDFLDPKTALLFLGSSKYISILYFEDALKDRV